MRKIVCYYHIYLTDNFATWSSIFIEHMKAMEDHRLIDAIDEMRVTVVAPVGSHRVDTFAKLLASYPIRTIIEVVDNPYVDDEDMLRSIETSLTVTENYTMRKIWNDSQAQDMKVLYLHSKGITSVMRHLEVGNVETYKKYHYWRQFLNWGVIENWRTCHEALRHADVAGVNLMVEPSKHFSGNFWWANSKYIRLLPDPSTKDWWIRLKAEAVDPWLRTASDRFRDEQWLCSFSPVSIFNVKTMPPDQNPSGKVLPRLYYDDPRDPNAGLSEAQESLPLFHHRV